LKGSDGEALAKAKLGKQSPMLAKARLVVLRKFLRVFIGEVDLGEPG
jgi:hypothetical protein